LYVNGQAARTDRAMLAERMFQQARVLYERWPEVEGEQW
jgi:hypothetical protein